MSVYEVFEQLAIKTSFIHTIMFAWYHTNIQKKKQVNHIKQRIQD